MALEPAGYRQALEQLVILFPNRAAIGIRDASACLGIDKRVILECDGFPIKRVGKKYLVSLTELARWMTK